MIRVLVTGDRNWWCHKIAGLVVGELVRLHGADGFVLVHGAATGVDSAFDGACRTLGVATEPHPALWSKYGPSAGPRRNSDMVALGADFCIAVHRRLASSKGTRDAVTKALAAGIPVTLIMSDELRPDGLPVAHRVTEV